MTERILLIRATASDTNTSISILTREANVTLSLKITAARAFDIRFPTSRTLAGSDAMNPDPDYSAAYVVLETDHPSGMTGNGMTFTIGRGNEICVKAIESLTRMVVGRDLGELVSNMGQFWKQVTRDSQLRWVGPDKGVIHLASAAIVNAVWDLWAKSEQLPLWKLVSNLSPEEIANTVDWTYLEDALPKSEAIERLSAQLAGRPTRIKQLEQEGYPAYTTSAGWLGYTDDQLRQLCREALSKGWSTFKIKVGRDLADDIRRCRILREEIGPDRRLMIDANQVWGVGQALTWLPHLTPFSPWFIEEPTHPDDILGHAAIAKAVAPIKVATGEHCANAIMFKQLLKAGGMQICQIDSCRLAGVNEVLAVMLMADKFGVPVCPHAGGVGLCEYVQHLAMIDYVCISGRMDDRVCEYADHLHEHFTTPIAMSNGRYQPPTAPGYSITFNENVYERYTFPSGTEWQ